jgi:phosphomannomutase
MKNYYNLFKAYDIRGTYPEIDAKIYYWAGYGLVEKILKPEGLPLKVNICHDCRYTSPEFYKAFYNGVKNAGGEPFALGLASTDFMYAASILLDTPGAMITASHNPKDDNGVKIVKKVPQMLGLSGGLDKVRDYVLSVIETEDMHESDWAEPVEKAELRSQVLEFFVQKYTDVGDVATVDQTLQKQGKKLKISVDAGNGMGGFVMEHLNNIYKNIEFIPLFWQPDGNYPNHPADPQNLDNLKDLQKSIIENQADFGVAFDGDADRAFFVDENTKPVQGDYLVAFFAKYMLNNYIPESGLNKAIVYCQPGSRCTPEIIAENEGVAIPSKQGHTFIKAEMQKYKALYGGEFSGHHYFGSFGFMDAGYLAMALFIKIIVNSGKSVSQTFEKIEQTYHISELMNVRIPAADNFENWKTKLKAAFPDGVFSELDGLSVFYPDWKFSMRASNTEPLVRFILETKIQNKTDEKVALVKSVVGII